MPVIAGGNSGCPENTMICDLCDRVLPQDTRRCGDCGEPVCKNCGCSCRSYIE